jgi:hypothetical protein
MVLCNINEGDYEGDYEFVSGEVAEFMNKLDDNIPWRNMCNGLAGDDGYAFKC